LTPAEQKEIAIWAGGALLLLVVAWWYVSGVGTEVDARDAEVAKLHGKYQQNYRETTGKMPADRALAALESAIDEQRVELAAVEARAVSKVPAAVLQVENYLRAATFAQERHRALEKRAQRLNLPFVSELPYEADGSLDNENLDRLRMQVLQIHTYSRLLDLVMDAGPRLIDVCLCGRPFSDPSGTYLVIPTQIGFVATWPVADGLLRSLRDTAEDFYLHGLELKARGGSLYRVEATVHLLLEKEQGLAFGEVQEEEEEGPRRGRGRGRGGSDGEDRDPGPERGRGR